MYRAAEVLLDAGVHIEFGPGRHGLGEQDFLYIREPSGLRIEFNAGGYRLAQPDWEPVGWKVTEGDKCLYQKQTPPHSLFERFPAEAKVEASEEAKQYFRDTTFFE